MKNKGQFYNVYYAKKKESKSMGYYPVKANNKKDAIAKAKSGLGTDLFLYSKMGGVQQNAFMKSLKFYIEDKTL